MTPCDLDTLHRHLPTGGNHATCVDALAEALAWNSRKVRRGLRALRRERHIGVVTSEGVFIATLDDVEALRHTRNGLHSRAMDLLVSCREIDMVIADLEWSPCLPIEQAIAS